SSRRDSQRVLLAGPEEEKDPSKNLDQHPVTFNSDTIAHTAVDPCTVAAGYKSNRMPYSVAKDTTFPFATNSRKDTADTAKALIYNVFVFKDLAVNRPTDKDYTKKLSCHLVNGSGDPSGADMGVRVATNSLADREFHGGISEILIKASDGHLSYDANCFRAFMLNEMGKR
ncbi:hypothetical protein BGW38_003587, partial [Lunasporangiospora selenospora]